MITDKISSITTSDTGTALVWVWILITNPLVDHLLSLVSVLLLPLCVPRTMEMATLKRESLRKLARAIHQNRVTFAHFLEGIGAFNTD